MPATERHLGGVCVVFQETTRMIHQTKLLAAVLAAAFTVPAAAQEPPAPGGQTPAVGTAAAEVAAAAPTVSVVFEGGTLADLLAAIRRQAPGVNIVASQIAEKVQLPRIELHGASLRAALDSVALVVPDPYRAKAVETRAKDASATVYSIAVITNQTQARPETEVRVFSLLSLIAQLPGEKGDGRVLSTTTVLSAIEAGARALGESIDLRFHEESNLLFVRGTRVQIDVVQQVLGSLQKDLDKFRKPAGDPPSGEPKK